MTKRQAKNKSDQLTTALQVLLVQTGSKSVVVQCLMSGPIDFEFRINGYTGVLDTIELTQEVEKILSNVRITSSKVYFRQQAIILIGKELGRQGIYSFTFTQDRA